MRESGREHSEMDGEYRNGRMGQSMRGIGFRIELMARVLSTIWMEMCMRVNGRMIRQMDMESTNM